MNIFHKSMVCALAMAIAMVWAIASGQNAAAPIHFIYEPIGFRLDSCETPRRHAPETMAGGVALFDYNNDSYLDVFFANGADIQSLSKTSPKYSNRLFENDGKGRFTDVTAKAGLAGTGFDNAVSVGDYDNDGREDLFVGGLHGNHLFRNDGGTFTDVTVKAGLVARDPQYGPLWSVGAAWVDVNNDGLLDLFVVNYMAWDANTEPPCEAASDKLDYCHPKFYKPTPNQLFLNNGDGTFRDVSAESGIRAHPGKGMGIGLADFDLDGLMDFFVPNDKMYNFLFHNKGSGRFEEIAFKAGVALAEDGQFISGMGVDSRDLDNDGLPDIALVALDHETFPLFRNIGRGGFADITRSSGLARLSLPMAGYSPTIADFDNDGWKDIFVTRGHVLALAAAAKVDIDQPNTVFRNLGGAKFQALTTEAGLTAQPAARHRGSAVGDLNGDGRLDIVTTALSAPAEVWLNDSPGRPHWLELKLEGTVSNRDSIGARIKVTTGRTVQSNHVSFAAGYASSSAAPLHFGLGPSETASLIEIRWPSGILQELRNVAADRLIRVKEPARK